MKKRRNYRPADRSSRDRPGKPEPGYANRRLLTKEEAKITGLDTFHTIMTEKETGRVTFWMEVSTGEYLRAIDPRDEQDELWKKLEAYWDSL